MIHPIKHFHVVHRHRQVVMQHCLKAGIPLQGLVHDLSKYSPTEFIPGAIYYMGDKSPTVMERQVHGQSKAWMHHKGRNKHHCEYWSDYQSKTKKQEPVRMPPKYVIEMFCDRVAACKVYQGSHYTDEEPLKFYRLGYGIECMHPETARVLEKWLVMLKEKGEEETFAYIRSLHRHIY